MDDSEEKMQQVIDSPSEDELPPGVGHDASDALAVLGLVAMFGAVLALGLGIADASYPSLEAVRQKILTFGTEFGVVVQHMGQIDAIVRNHTEFALAVVVVAIKLDKPCQGF